MKFDVYFPFKGKDGKMIPGVTPHQKTWDEVMQIASGIDVASLIAEIRSCDPVKDKQKKADLKKELPAICWTGVCSGRRSAASCIPTHLVMVDLDGCKDAKKTWERIKEFHEEWVSDRVVVAHITPSGGLRIVFKAMADMESLTENLEWFGKHIYEEGMAEHFDTAVKDLSRLSFLFQAADLLYSDKDALDGDNSNYRYIRKMDGGSVAAPAKAAEKTEFVADFTAEEIERYEALEYKGTPLRVIIKKYVEFFGEPGTGEKHGYYNEMVKNFRCICDNNKRALLYLLPRFGHTIEECNSQIVSICRVNTLSTLPKKFYFFLKDNGYYNNPESSQGALREFMMDEHEETPTKPPYLPPVLRELVGTAPIDFVPATINALLPILGTLTSYVQARYPYDDRMHTTSFFSVIYAPPSTGKGFVERFMDLLFEDLRVRDFIQSERENVYLRAINRKGDNEKAPDRPQTSLRLIPAKNSEAEFLEKQRDNHGYHMFTYAAEMDSWAKGAKAAGGNKDDMIRIAWDNGEYGQQFKSANTFKGTVRLYWNVLICGTLQQIENYFKNVENGLVTRCSFTSIENQEFSKPGKWKQLSAKKKNVIKAFVKRCDENTYTEPCTLVPSDLEGVRDEDFDKEVEWKFKFKERQTLDCSWIMPVIDKFHEEQMAKAVLDVDRARDVFRRRVGVRGFRLALICMCLWEKPRREDLEKCKSFIKWWMDCDLENMLKLWGEKYNNQTDSAPKLTQRTVFAELPETFSRNDVYVVCMKQGIKTPIRRILFDWKKMKYIEQKDKDTFVKKVS